MAKQIVNDLSEYERIVKCNDNNVLGVKFNNIDFRAIDFNSVIFIDCVFHHCCLPSIYFSRFRDVRFLECNFYNTMILHSIFGEKCEFMGCNFNSVTFEHCDIMPINKPPEFVDNIFNMCYFYYTRIYTTSHKTSFNNCTFDMGTITSNSFVDFDYKNGEILCEDIVGYKAVCSVPPKKITSRRERPDAIVTLSIPSGAIVVSPNGTKCRTNKAKVVQIEDSKGFRISKGFSYYDPNTIYRPRRWINVEHFDTNIHVECSNGIHFFKTKEEAIGYMNNLTPATCFTMVNGHRI